MFVVFRIPKNEPIFRILSDRSSQDLVVDISAMSKFAVYTKFRKKFS
jgi:hypothetical protein